MAWVKSTDDVPPPDREEYWREAICDGLAPHEITVAREPAIRGRMTAADVGLLLMRNGEGPATRMTRTSALIRRSDPELVYLLAQVDGRSNVTFEGGGEFALGPGDLMLGDTSVPSSIDVLVPSSMHRVVMPRTLLPLSQRDLARVIGTLIPSQSGPAAVLNALLRELVSHLDDADLASNVSLSVAVVDVLTAIAAARLDCNGTVPTPTRHAALLLQVKEFIEAHLTDRGLSPASIAAAHHVSLRQLQKLFAAEDDTVTGRVRKRRLERCRADLLDPSCGHQSAAMIGARWGYPNAAAFSRAFAAQYGMPPMAYRSAHLPGRG
jgi:AraC-like DNA-binding protein